MTGLGDQVEVLAALPSAALRDKAQAMCDRHSHTVVSRPVSRSATEIVGSLAQIHPSDSTVQLLAEAQILATLQVELGVKLVPTRLRLPSGASVHVDGVSRDPDVLVEVFAHQGRFRGGQHHKVSTDILKLATVRRVLLPGARLILALADEAAAASLVGWKREAVAAWAVEVRVVELPESDRERIAQAQLRQRMVNPSDSRVGHPADGVEVAG